MPASLIPGGIITGKSIFYQYTSSSSTSSGRTTGTSSLGAVGDHLASIGSASMPRSAVTIGGRNSMTRATSRTRSPLADLVLSSSPDQEPYQLLALGQTGPWKQPFTPQFVKPLDLCTLIRRRRSLSDLKENPQARLSLVSAEVGAPNPQVSKDMKVSGPGNVQIVKKDVIVQPDEIRSIESTTPPVWSRKGPPFVLNDQNHILDPETFSLPFGVRPQLLSYMDLLANAVAVESFHHEIDQHPQPASFSRKWSLVFNKGRKQSATRCLGG